MFMLPAAPAILKAAQLATRILRVELAWKPVYAIDRMQIFVKTITGRTVSLEVDSDQKVSSLTTRAVAQCLELEKHRPRDEIRI